MTDDLYDRLRAADPVPGAVPVEPAGSPRTRALMEAAMSTPTNAPHDTSDHIGSDHPTTSTAAPRRSSRWLPAAIAASAAGIILAGALLVPDMLDDSTTAPTTLALSMPTTDPVMQMCMQLTADELRRMPVAFAGTATDVTADTVTLSVDDWYKGGDANLVTLETPPAAPVALLGYGIDFEAGTKYLITATDGTVNICGYSGEATPELQAAFDEAYAG